MKRAGMTRPLDELGRITLPIELRKTMGLAEKDRMLITVEGEEIHLKKYRETKRDELRAMVDQIEEEDIEAVMDIVRPLFLEER